MKLREIKCWLGAHEKYVHQEFTPYARRIGCRHCYESWAMNDDVRIIVRWNSQFHALYELHGHVIRPLGTRS